MNCQGCFRHSSTCLHAGCQVIQIVSLVQWHQEVALITKQEINISFSVIDSSSAISSGSAIRSEHVQYKAKVYLAILMTWIRKCVNQKKKKKVLWSQSSSCFSKVIGQNIQGVLFFAIWAENCYIIPILLDGKKHSAHDSSNFHLFEQMKF